MSVNKVCNQCNTKKDISCFYKNTTYISGYENKCKDCRNKNSRTLASNRRLERLKNNSNLLFGYKEMQNKDMNGEIWKDIPISPMYQASNLGRIRSKNRLSKNGVSLKGLIKQPSIHPSGYLRYTLTINGEYKQFYGHDLVAMAFIGERPTGCDIDHIDHVRVNNNIDNLRYITHRENRGHLLNLNAKKYECK